MENQNLEWKESWRDEHMKTLCAFANASGGTLEIGRKLWGKSEPFYRIRANEVMIGFNINDGIVENIVENDNINAMQMKILELMRKNPSITAKTIAQTVDIAPRNVQVYIQSLKALGLVERIGAAKGGHWVVK